MNSDLIQKIYHASPSLKFCDSFDGMSPLWNYSRHRHPYIELIYRKNGRGRTDLLEESHRFSYFDTLVYPVDCWHEDKFEANPENDCCCLWVDMPEAVLDKPLQVHDQNGALGSLFHAILEEHRKISSSSELLSLMIRTLLIQILMYSEESKPSTIEQIIQYLNAHLAEKITLDGLAAVTFMSKSYMVRQFKLETGKTIIAYLNELRIEKAKMLLATTTKTVTEVAYSVGFDSPKYFYRTFKTIAGMTPATFSRRDIDSKRNA